jgi:hypothetical protein
MLLTPWLRFEGLAWRQERDSANLVLTFRLDDMIRTIAQFWSPPDILRARQDGWTSSKPFDDHLRDSAAEGRLWWGIEYPPESNLATSFLYWLPRECAHVAAAKDALKLPSSPKPPLETSLELI